MFSRYGASPVSHRHTLVVSGALLFIYSHAVHAQSPDPQALIQQGQSQSRAGQFSAAIASYQSALHFSPHNLSAEVALAKAYRAVHNDNEARRLLEQSAREHPKSADPLLVLGDLEIQMQTYEAAIRHLTAAVALAPTSNEARDRLAVALKSKGDSAAALAQLSKSLTHDPNDALAHFLRAEIYDDSNDDARAQPEAEKALDLQPQNPRARGLLAKILLRAASAQSAADAKSACARAVELAEPNAQADPTDAETLFLLSRAQHCAGQLDEEKQTLEKFEAASKNQRSTRENENQALHLVQQANDRALHNDFPGAVDLITQALEKNPNYGPAYSQLAKLYYSAGDLEKASEAITRALALQPYQPDFLYVAGKILEKQGKLDESLDAFQQSTLVNPNEADSFYEMGTIYKQKNDQPKARSAFEQALKLSPDDPDYRRAVDSLR